MALPATILSNYGQSNLDTSVNNAAVGISPAGQFFTLVALGGLIASGATLTIEGSTDNGATWAAVSATHATSRVSGSAVTADGLYKVPTGTRTHFRLRVSSVGSGLVTVGAVGGSTPQDVLSVDASGNPVGGGGNTGGGGSSDPAVAAGIGAPADSAYSGTGSGTVIAVLKRVAGLLSGTLTTTINGMLPAGTNFLGYFGLANGPLTYAAPASGSVGTSSAPLIAAGAYSNLIIITTAPSSAGNVFLGIGSAAVAGSGFCVPAGGGSFTFSKTGPVPLPASGQAINAISDSGTVAVAIQGA